MEVTRADIGLVELRLPWRKELGQYSGLLHAGMAATVMETASGFAAATQCGPQVVVSHFSVNCLRPARGTVFIARARVVKASKTQSFTQCDLFAVDEAGAEKLVANCEAVLASSVTAA